MKLEELDTLIPQYAANKAEMEDYKKICEKENARIKEIMRDFVVPNYTTGDYTASYTVSQRETMNEETLISLFTTVPSFYKINDAYKVVKFKPYIDFDALEKALYDNAFTDEQIEQIDRTRETKEVVTLKVKKKKEDKE